MNYHPGDLIPLATGALALVEEILPQGRYKVILPNVKQMPDGYTTNVTNVAIIKPIAQYFIEEYI